MDRHRGVGGLSAVAGREYLVILEGGPEGFSGYAPDLPIVVAAGETRDEVEQLMREGIALYLETLRERGSPIPAARTTAITVAGG